MEPVTPEKMRPIPKTPIYTSENPKGLKMKLQTEANVLSTP